MAADYAHDLFICVFLNKSVYGHGWDDRGPHIHDNILCYHRKDAQQSRWDDYERLGCVLPPPFKKGETWYDMEFGKMQKKRWRSTLAVWIKKWEST